MLDCLPLVDEAPWEGVLTLEGRIFSTDQKDPFPLIKDNTINCEPGLVQVQIAHLCFIKRDTHNRLPDDGGVSLCSTPSLIPQYNDPTAVYKACMTQAGFQR